MHYASTFEPLVFYMSIHTDLSQNCVSDSQKTPFSIVKTMIVERKYNVKRIDRQKWVFLRSKTSILAIEKSRLGLTPTWCDICQSILYCIIC